MIFTAPSSPARKAEHPVLRAVTAALLLACIGVPAAQAKQSDRSATIHVNADSFDSQAKPNGVTHLKGHVVITQGTFKATSATALVYFDSHSNVSRVVLKGSPAHIEQLDDNGNLIKGHAATIDYKIPSGIATLTDHAYIRQEGRGTARGQVLVYNTRTSVMSARGQGKNRVHLTFQPGEQKAAPASSSGN